MRIGRSRNLLSSPKNADEQPLIMSFFKSENFTFLCFTLIMVALAISVALTPGPSAAECKRMCPKDYVPHLSAEGECSCTSECETPRDSK